MHILLRLPREQDFFPGYEGVTRGFARDKRQTAAERLKDFLLHACPRYPGRERDIHRREESPDVIDEARQTRVITQIRAVDIGKFLSGEVEPEDARVAAANTRDDLCEQEDE